MKYTTQKSRDGGVLLLVLLVVLVMTVLGAGLLKVAHYDALEVVTVQERSRAFWLAEAGLNELKGITRNSINLTPLTTLGLVGDNVIYKDLGDLGSYSVDIEDVSAALARVKRYIVTSTGTTPGGISRGVEVHVRISTFGNYIFATHTEGWIRFRSGDVIVGDVYSNDRLTIDGDPTFKGYVYSAADSIRYFNPGGSIRGPTHVDEDVFTLGIELNQPELNFGQLDGTNPLDRLNPGSGPDYYDGNFDIEFMGASYRTRPHTADDSGTWATNNLPSFPNSIIFYVTGNAYVEGRVGGSVAVVSDEVIHITGDIVYASCPDNDYSDWPEHYEPYNYELLGLYSKEAVQVDSHGYGIDINIHAAVYVTEADDFVNTSDHNPVQNGWDINPGFGTQDRFINVGNPKINLLGSISQHKRGIVGRTNGDGFEKNYEYDNRFYDTPPPGMPYSAFTFSKWRQLQ